MHMAHKIVGTKTNRQTPCICSAPYEKYALKIIDVLKVVSCVLLQSATQQHTDSNITIGFLKYRMLHEDGL